MKMQAVLTGDIVGSSELSHEDHRRVVDLVKSVADAYPDVVVGKVDVFSGDSWQMLVSDCSSSLRIALYLRALLKREMGPGIDSRVSIAWGEVEMAQVNLERISESTGEVFTASGRGIGLLKRSNRLHFSALNVPVLDVAVRGMLGLVDALAGQWSREQARAIVASLEGMTQAAIAEEFGIAQSTVNKSLQAALFTQIEELLGSVDEVLVLVNGEKNHPAG